MSAPKLRMMRARDMVKYSRYTVPRFAGLVAEMDGEEIGAVAIVIGIKGRPYLSFEITPKIRQMPVFMTKVAKKMIATGVEQLGELYAIEDRTEPGAGRWLQRLGFVPTEEFIDGERVYTWRPSLQQ